MLPGSILTDYEIILKYGPVFGKILTKNPIANTPNPIENPHSIDKSSPLSSLGVVRDKSKNGTIDRKNCKKGTEVLSIKHFPTLILISHQKVGVVFPNQLEASDISVASLHKRIMQDG